VTKKNLTPEDSDLFRLTIGKVQTVKSDKVLLTVDIKPKPYPKTPSINVDEHSLGADEFEIESVGIADSLSFTIPGLQHNVLKKLRKGQFGVDGEIDLHGLNSHEAKQQLLHFLHHCVEEGNRCVHIVHGKGYRSADNHPVLKNNLNLWLRQHKDIQAFCSATPENGGTGAVFVLLQLSKN
jgi:DNA-nicking Smr family endonuclease